MSVQAGYVTSLARHLEVFPGSNRVTSIVDYHLNDSGSQGGLPFPDFGQKRGPPPPAGTATTTGLQTKVEKQFAGGLNFLSTYT